MLLNRDILNIATSENRFRNQHQEIASRTNSWNRIFGPDYKHFTNDFIFNRKEIYKINQNVLKVVNQSSNFHFRSDKTDFPVVVNGTSSSSKTEIQVSSRASGRSRREEKRELLSRTSQYRSFFKTRMALVDREYMALQSEKLKAARNQWYKEMHHWKFGGSTAM